nr:PAS domain S-box protein [Candidatus Omnitrophota bacterium]
DTPWWEHSKAEQEKLRQAVDKVRAGGFARFETTHVAKDGATHIVDFSLKPVKDKSGKVIFMVPEGRDITESRLADKELLDSQEEYEIVVNNALDGIWWVDMEGDFKQVNDAYCKMSGYSQKELLNMNISDVEHNETKADVKRHIQLIKEAGKLSFETKHRRKDGSVYDLEVNVKYIPMHGGRLIAVIRDITERKDKERIIKEGRARLDLALVSSGMGVWSFDIGRNKRDFDGQTCYLLGIDKEKFSGTPEEFYGVVHPDDRQTIKETLSKAIKENGVYRCEYRVVRPDKSIRHIAARGSVEYDEKARPLRVNGVIWDIAENKRKEEELLESKRLLDSTGSLANVGGWQIYAGSRELTWTEEVYRIHEVASSYIPTIDNGISFYAPESRPVIKNAVESLLERGEPFDLQLKFVTAKGNQRHVRAIGRANKVDGKIVSVYGAFQDITERKKIEEDMALINRKLKHAAEEWRATFDSMTAMISIHDKDYRIVRVNKAFADAFKGKPQDFIGKLCYEVVHKTGSPPDWCPHTRTLETKTPQEMEFFDPELKIHLEVHTSPIFDINGEFIGSVHVAQDISDRKKIEASQRLALLGELVAEMAHEVNNPLMIIAGKAQLYLMKHREDKELADNLKIILDECMRAKEIIHNLLVFSKPSKGEVKEADIKKTLDDIVMLLEHQYKLAGISIVKNYGKDIPGVWIDEKGIQAVAMNLLKNAAESMPQGGTITVSIYTDGGFLKIDFNDTGSGIDPENIAKLFQPFFTTKENGTGLGLPVCYGIIKAHGGEIKVKSDLGIGTTMTIMIPLGGGKA